MAEFNREFRLGVLGGGQLGRMMIQSAFDLDLNIEVLDNSKKTSIWPNNIQALRRRAGT